MKVLFDSKLLLREVLQVLIEDLSLCKTTIVFIRI